MDPLRNTFARRRANQNREQNAIILSQNTQTSNVGHNSSVAATAVADLVVEQIMQETYLQNQCHMAKNTNISYDPKIKEFKAWCDEIYSAADPSCRYTVTEGKLVAFLQTCVINRKNKTSDKEVGISTVKAYRNAVVDLYKTHVSLKINSHPRPGLGKTISELLKSVKREKVDRMKRNYVDRGREGFRMKSFTTEQLYAISNYHWNSTDKVHESLRDNVAEFNTRAMSLRGEHLRNVELPDLFIDDIGEQGQGECKTVITVLNRGKTNKYCNNEFAATFRSKDVYMCPQSKMAFYFFHRFDQSEKELPSFETNQSWFDIKVYRQSQSYLKKKEVSYDVHLRAVQKCYLACGLRGPKKLISCVVTQLDLQRQRV